MVYIYWGWKFEVMIWLLTLRDWGLKHWIWRAYIYFQELYLGARWTGLMLCVNVKLDSKLQRFLFPVFKLLYLILFKWFLWILIFFYQLHFFIVTTIVVVIPSHGCLWHILLLFFSPEQYSNNSKDIH